VEIRDRATCIYAVATQLGPETIADGEVICRMGFSRDHINSCRFPVILYEVNMKRGFYDPHAWGENPRTLFHAHKWIADHFDEIESCDVIDVEYILGETSYPKLAERLSLLSAEAES
jgi:hypothetical protein